MGNGHKPHPEANGNIEMKLKSCKVIVLLMAMGVLQDNTRAEISTDGSLGAAASLTGPDYAITSDLGTQVGSNLFHSFQVFNIDTGESATFSGPDSVANILGRVTGGSVSSIDGAINSTIPGANLYLVNPSGVVFGENASLNVGGSFHVSTADYLTLTDGGRFDVSTPGNSVLTTAPPAAFGFLDAPAGLDFQDSFLEVPAGAALTVTGGDMSMADSILYAPEGSIGIASVASAGELSVDPEHYATDGFDRLGSIEMTHTGDVFSRFVPGVGLVGNVDVSGDSAGTVAIRAGELHVDRILIFADTATGSGALIDIAIDDEMRLSSGSTISADVVDSGQGGVVRVSAGTLVLESGGRLQAISVATGQAGNIQLNASDAVVIGGRSDPSLPLLGDQASGLFGFVTDTGDGGSISVNTPELTVTGGGEILVDTGAGGGSGGTLVIDAGEVVLMDGGLIQADTQGSGDAGSIELNVNSLEITGGANISSKTIGTGKGGSIAITAADDIAIAGSGDAGPSGIFSNAFSTGDGGAIMITTPRLTLTDGAKIQAGVGESSEVAGLPPATAATRAGEIIIHADNLTLSGKAQISTQSENAGQAGDINIDAAEGVEITSPSGSVQSGIFSTASGTGSGGSISIRGGVFAMDGGAVNVSSAQSGDGGSIDIAVNRLDMNHGAQVSSSASGTGSGGPLRMTVAGDAVMAGRADGGFRTGIYSQTTGSGKGGAVTLSATDVSIQDGAIVTAGSTGTGDGGSVNVTVENALNLQDGTITTEAATGKGGNIGVTAAELDMADGAQISSSASGAGDGGNVALTIAGSAQLDGQDTGLLSQAAGSGSGGSVSLDAATVSLTNAAVISTESTGTGDGGRIALTAANGLEMKGASVTSDAAAGNGGDIVISAGRLALAQGATVSSSAFGAGNGGNVNITVAGDAQLSGAGSGISTRAEGGGAGGSVKLSAQDVTLADGSVISAASTGTGDAGNIGVAAVDTVTLQDSAITTRAAVADGGNVKITADSLVYLNDSEVTAAVGTGAGNGGNVTIDPEFVVLASSRILANAFGGNGGNITIIADHFISSADSVLDASSELGIDGTVNILSPDEEVDSNLVELPVNYQDAAGLLRERCSARQFSGRSSFTMSGRKGVPAAPGAMSMTASPLGDNLPATFPSGGAGAPLTGGTVANNFQGALLPVGYLSAAAWGCSL